MTKIKSTNQKALKKGMKISGGATIAPAEDFQTAHEVPISSSISGFTNSKIVDIVLLVIIIVIICVSLYAIYKHFSNKRHNEPLLIDQPVDATIARMILSENIPTSDSNEFTINFWMFVRDWNHNYNKPKCVLYYGDPNCKQASPLIFLYPNTNNLMIRMAQNKKCEGKSMNPFSCNYEGIFDNKKPCDVSNIPLQRWVQISVVLWNTTTDVYVNGKLARSCTYPDVPKMMTGQNIYIGQGGGFNGYISRLRYFNYAIDPRQAYVLYKDGPYKQISWITRFANRLSSLTSGTSCSETSKTVATDNDGEATTPNPDAFKYDTIVVQGEGEGEDGEANVIVKTSCNAI